MGCDQAFMPAMKHPLAATILSEQQCENIQGSVKDTVASEMGQKISKAILSTLEMNGGPELGNIHMEQGMTHATFMIQCMQTKPETAKMILCPLKTHQLRAHIDHDTVTNTEHVAGAEALWINKLKEIFNIN